MPSATPNSRIVEFAELAIAKSSSGQPVEHHRRAGREGQAHADAGHQQRRDERRVARAVLGEHREPDQRRRLEHQPGEQQRPEPSRPDQGPAIGATTIGAAVHGSVRRPASSGL